MTVRIVGKVQAAAKFAYTCCRDGWPV